MKKATPEQAVAATTVFWDIKSCPVPLGFDARQVGPSIKRFLKNLGYSGPLTIKALGILTNVPGDILRAVSSTGIVLNHVARGTEDIRSLLYVWGMENISLANVMVISTPPNCSHVLKNLGYSGPLTIKASGILTNVPGDILRAFSSTGIVLNHVARGTEDIQSLLYVWGMVNISLANVMVISTPPNCSHVLKNLGYSGPLTIKASGILTNVPGDILRAFSSTGIVLNHVARGTEDIQSLLYVWGMVNISLANVMVISTPPNCSHVLKSLSEWGLNVIYPFPYESPSNSAWNNFLDSEAPEEDKCRETGESSDLWVCSVCHDVQGRGFEKFISHLSGREHRVMLSHQFSTGDFFKDLGSYPVKPSRKDTPGAETSVFWDITRCPVPPGFDARQVGPLIKGFLKNLGFSGPPTITAVGILTHVPEDILLALSSTGIVLNDVSCLQKDMERLLSRCSIKDKSPAAANVMVITTPPSYSSILSTLSQRGLNVIHPFPYEEEEEDEEEEEEEETADLGSLWIYSLMADSEEPEEDKCRETGDSSALWVCSECRVHEGRIQGFEKLMSYLSGPEQRLETWVFWDINRCPVPLGFDARQVGPSIKRFLKNLGYSGPLAIIAVGILTHVPEDILRAVSSTGIVLYHVPRGTEDIESLLSRCSMKDKSPAVANVMVITTTPSYSSILFTLSQRGLNVIYPFPGSLWSSAPEELEEDKCRETGESSDLWVCSVCHDVEGRGFEKFISHLSGREYRVMLPLWFPEPQGP